MVEEEQRPRDYLNKVRYGLVEEPTTYKIIVNFIKVEKPLNK